MSSKEGDGGDGAVTLAMEFPFHPAADLFPMMSAAELDALGEDMLEHGQREDISLYKGAILDGRNRYRACLLKGIAPRFREERPADFYAFVVTANIHRRHLDASQRAMIAAELATLRDGERKQGASRDTASQAEAAAIAKVSRPSVQRARVVQERGVPDLIDAVKHGDVRVKPAAEFAQAVPPLDQARLIAEHGSPAAAVQATVKAKADRAEARADNGNGAAWARRKIIDRFADGKWHSVTAIEAYFRGECEVKPALTDLVSDNKAVKAKGQYLIYRDDAIKLTADELEAKLGPIVAGLKAEGKKNMATISISAVAMHAEYLDRQLQAWKASARCKVRPPAPETPVNHALLNMSNPVADTSA